MYDSNYYCLANLQGSDTGTAHTHYMYAEPVSASQMAYGAWAKNNTSRILVIGRFS